MKLAVVALTRKGSSLARSLTHSYQGEAVLFLPPSFADETKVSAPLYPYVPPLGEFLGSLWTEYEGLVLVMAAGIAVRTLAHYLDHKSRDPAVVVLDEGGRWAISLVGGHWAGANDLAREVAALVGAEPVITTATDAQGKTGIDLLARDLGLLPEPWSGIKAVNSALVNGEPVAVYRDTPAWDDALKAKDFQPLPLEDFSPRNKGVPVFITSRYYPDLTGPHLYLRPRRISAGIGCRRGTGSEEIITALHQAFQKAQRSVLSLARLASIDIKTGEEGLWKAASHFQVPLEFFGPMALEKTITKGGLSRSDLVRKRIGVDGVCEPAALLAGEGTTLILPKTTFPGVAVALAEAACGWWESGPVTRTT